jgi:hypothetical protein
MMCYPPGVSSLPPFPEPMPVWPGCTLSICHHNAIYMDCGTCQKSLSDWRDRREAWDELHAILLTLDWLFAQCQVH